MHSNSFDDYIGWLLKAKTPTPVEYSNARRAAELPIQTIRRALYPRRMSHSVSGDSLVVGSIGKRTALSPIQTLDLLYVLPQKLQPHRAEEALQIVMAGLSTEFTDTDLMSDRLGVSVPVRGLIVRIIPAIKNDRLFLIPNPEGKTADASWTVSNPVSEAASIRLSDQLTNGLTRQLLILLKCWKGAHALALPALALELLLFDYLAENRPSKPIKDVFKDFMAWARSRTPATLSTADGSVHVPVDDSWHGAARAAYWRMTLADSGTDGSAVHQIQGQAIFGAEFSPPPGDFTHEANRVMR